MKKEGEIKLLREERRKGASQTSQMKKPRRHRTREIPFSLDWS